MQTNNTERAPTVDRVLSDIRDRIILNQFPAGQPIPEVVLADQYSVSRGSVRTAIQILANEGLIEIGSNGRKTPIRMNEEFVKDCYSTRLMLECEAIRICLEKKDVNVAHIATAFAEFYKLYALSGNELYLQRNKVNTEFHRSIVRTAGSPSLINCWNTIEPIINSVTKFNYLTLADKQSSDELVETHQTMMKLILEKDAEALVVAKEHISHALRETLDAMANDI